MKFLDQNGVLTLWNKIKDNFLSTSGGTIAYETSSRTTLNGHSVSVGPYSLLLYPFHETVIYEDKIVLSYTTRINRNNTVLTYDHSNVNEYAKPIQDLESILV